MKILVIVLLGFTIIYGSIKSGQDRETKTMGVSVSDIREAKADCEKSGKECVIVWDFVEVEADYE